MEELLQNLKLEFVVLGLILIPLVIGLLLGMLRGSRRATLRLVLVILCIVAAFLLRGVATDFVMQMKIQDQTVEELILAQLPKEVAQFGDKILVIVRLIVTVVLFLALFLVFKLVSWIIIYPICKIFVKKARTKKDGSHGKKHALIGGVIGLVQGAAVAVVLCVVFNGLLVNVGNLLESVDALQQSASSVGGATNVSIVMTDEDVSNDDSGEKNGNGETSVDMIQLLTDYKQSSISQIISNGGGDKAFDLVASIKTENGKTLTLTGQLDAINGIIKMLNELVSLNDTLKNMGDQLKGGLNGDIASTITGVFNALDDICVNMSDEAKETVNEIMQTLADSLDMGSIDMSVLDFTTISFRNEGQVIANLTEYKDKNFTSLTEEEAQQEAKDIVGIVMESDIILPLLSANADFTVGLTDKNKDFAVSVIEDLEKDENVDEKKVEMLKHFFGLYDNVPAQGDN